MVMVKQVLCLGLLGVFSLLQICPWLLAGCRREGEASEKRARQQADAPKRGTSAQDEKNKKVFYSPLAGSWYEADPGLLGSQIDGFLSAARQEPLGDVCALVLPHAGLRWSGQTAAYGVKQILGSPPDRIIVIGPSHRVPMRNMASVPDVTHYATPFGETRLDTELIDALKTSRLFRTVPEANNQEHSVQIALPLFQRALGSSAFLFVPVVVGHLDIESARAIADVLLQRIDEKTLVVASSDFTHYGPSFDYVPFTGSIAENIEKIDMAAYGLIEKKDLHGFETYIERTGATICGRSAIAVLLAMLPNDARAHLLRYDTSGALTGDYTNSVSYLSIAFTGQWRKPMKTKAPSAPAKAEISPHDKKNLLALARGALRFYLEKGKVPKPEALGVQITPGMKQVMGAFVTLKKHGQLRGCIGEIYPKRPLYEAVIERAVDAGVHDPRFPPVTMDEFRELHFEISALTPPRPIDSYKDIVIGRHGVVLQKAGRSAVFLPQVAPEQGWDVEEMLYHLSLKAGLPGDAWKEGASFTVFEAIVFEDEHVQ